MKRVHVVRTGVANLASVRAGLERAGFDAVVTDDSEKIARAEIAMLPGVGAFGAGIASLRESGCDEALRERIAADRPTLTICLGLQLLAASSEETPGERGLCVFPEAVTRFPDTVRVPQFGWNHVAPTAGARFLRPGYAYFANSFRLSALPAGCYGALGDHGGPFVAAIERGALLACQFHPELSGAWGAELLARWLGAASC